jgi:hypothetical protein
MVAGGPVGVTGPRRGSTSAVVVVPVVVPTVTTPPPATVVVVLVVPAAPVLVVATDREVTVHLLPHFVDLRKLRREDLRLGRSS